MNVHTSTPNLSSNVIRSSPSFPASSGQGSGLLAVPRALPPTAGGRWASSTPLQASPAPDKPASGRPSHLFAHAACMYMCVCVRVHVQHSVQPHPNQSPLQWAPGRIPQSREMHGPERLLAINSQPCRVDRPSAGRERQRQSRGLFQAEGQHTSTPKEAGPSGGSGAGRGRRRAQTTKAEKCPRRDLCPGRSGHVLGSLPSFLEPC